MAAISARNLTKTYGDLAAVPLAILAGFAIVVTVLAARLFRWEST